MATTSLTEYSNEQIDLIKRTIAKGATDDELALFIHQCKRTGLDPFSKQIFFIERRFKAGNEWKKKMEIQTSIDGFRLIAERSGKYAGQLGPYWCGDDGIWKDVWIGKTAPAASKVGIIHMDFKEPLYGVATWESYVQQKDGQPTFMWQKMPDVMLAKCAESLALRKAFPQELSALYSQDEMAQADTHDTKPVYTPPLTELPKPTIASPQRPPNQASMSTADLAYEFKALLALALEHDWTQGQIRSFCKLAFNIDSSNKLTREQLTIIHDAILEGSYYDIEKRYLAELKDSP